MTYFEAHSSLLTHVRNQKKLTPEPVRSLWILFRHSFLIMLHSSKQMQEKGFTKVTIAVTDLSFLSTDELYAQY